MRCIEHPVDNSVGKIAAFPPPRHGNTLFTRKLAQKIIKNMWIESMLCSMSSFGSAAPAGGPVCISPRPAGVAGTPRGSHRLVMRRCHTAPVPVFITPLMTAAPGDTVFSNLPKKRLAARRNVRAAFFLASSSGRIQSRPRAAIDTGSPAPITRWSSTRTPISSSARPSSWVIARSAALGSATPLGWL